MKKTTLLVLLLTLGSQLLANDTIEKCYDLLAEQNFQESYIQALTLLNHPDNEIVSEAYYIMGYARRKQNHFSEALRYYEKAIEESNDPDKKGKISNNIAILLQFTSLHEQAVEVADKAIPISEKWQLVSIYNKAFSLRMLKRYDEALSTIQQGVKVCQATQNDVYILKFWNLQAEIIFDQDNSSMASQLLQEVIETGTQTPADGKPYVKSRAIELGKAYLLLADILLVKGDSVAARQHLEDALEIQTDPQERFEVLIELAKLSEDKTPWIEEALRLYPKLTLSEKTLKVFFMASGTDLIDMKMFEEEFDKYVRQEKATQEVYTAYIGRQMLKEQALLDEQKAQRRWNFIAGITVLVIAASFLLFLIRSKGQSA